MLRFFVLLFLGLLATAVYVFAECEGTFFGNGTGLVCSSPCTEGCTTGTTTLPNGQMATICYCDIIGPQPNCCRIAVLPTGVPVPTGSCNAAGCATSGSCSLYVKVNSDGDPIEHTAKCKRSVPH